MEKNTTSRNLVVECWDGPDGKRTLGERLTCPIEGKAEVLELARGPVKKHFEKPMLIIVRDCV